MEAAAISHDSLVLIKIQMAVRVINGLRCVMQLQMNRDSIFMVSDNLPMHVYPCMCNVVLTCYGLVKGNDLRKDILFLPPYNASSANMDLSGMRGTQDVRTATSQLSCIYV